MNIKMYSDFHYPRCSFTSWGHRASAQHHRLAYKYTYVLVVLCTRSMNELMNE